MDPGLIRWIDKNIGRPCCFFLTLHRRLSDILKKRDFSYKTPSKLLFIKLVEQGSTVLAYPAMKKAESLLGKENLYFMVFRENLPILDVLGIIPKENILEIDSENILNFFFSSLKALARIRKEKIDGVIDMEFFARVSAVFSYLSGAGKRAGSHIFNSEGPYRGDLFTHRLIYNPYLATKIFFLSLVEALNHAPSPKSAPMTFSVPEITADTPRFVPSDEEKKALIREVEKLKGSALSYPVVILNPNTGDLLPIRKWPAENFVKLGNMLLREYPQATTVLTGLPKEKDEVEKIAAKIKNSVSMAGRTSLKKLLTLYCVADVLVTNDSGPGQFSVLTPLKSVILFGPETPVLYGEANDKRDVIYSSLACSPCVNVYNHRQSVCKTGECLRNISVEDVYKAVKKKLSMEL